MGWLLGRCRWVSDHGARQEGAASQAISPGQKEPGPLGLGPGLGVHGQAPGVMEPTRQAEGFCHRVCLLLPLCGLLRVDNNKACG